MIIESIELNNYRNYESLFVELDPKINIFFGKNAQGKTNLLEACYLSATTKSHRSSKDKEIIRFGEQESHIKTDVIKSNSHYRIDIHLKKNKAKGIAINKVPVKRAGDLFGILRVIFFSPEDLNIIKNGPAERRRFLDMELCQIDKLYLDDLTKYNKLLNQRNKALKDIINNPSLKETISVWTEQLIQYGKKIIKKREQFIEELKEIVRKNYSRIAANKEVLNICYEPNVTMDDYERKMADSIFKDERFAQTHVGPHRDDIKFSIGEMDARLYASQGQQRSCALSLKLSEIEIMEKMTGEKPVLLLDDVLSELDADRQKDLLKSLYDVQTLMTCTGMEDLIKESLGYHRIFSVSQATIEKISQ